MPTLEDFLGPLARHFLKNKGLIGTARSENVGIDVYFIKIGQSKPEILPNMTLKYCKNVSVPPTATVPYMT